MLFLSIRQANYSRSVIICHYNYWQGLAVSDDIGKGEKLTLRKAREERLIDQCIAENPHEGDDQS